MKRVKEFFNVLIYVFDQELNRYEGYVTTDVDKGYLAGIKMAKELISKVYKKMYVE